MQWSFIGQGHAEDVLMRYSYLYYVKGVSLITDGEFDALADTVRKKWSVSYASHCVGSSVAGDYPLYVQEGRRPDAVERKERDCAIVERWLKYI